MKEKETGKCVELMLATLFLEQKEKPDQVANRISNFKVT